MSEKNITQPRVTCFVGSNGWSNTWNGLQIDHCVETKPVAWQLDDTTTNLFYILPLNEVVTTKLMEQRKDLFFRDSLFCRGLSSYSPSSDYLRNTPAFWTNRQVLLDKVADKLGVRPDRIRTDVQFVIQSPCHERLPEPNSTSRNYSF